MRLSLLVGLMTVALTVAACGTPRPASVAGGECRVFTRPVYVIKGANDYSQKWADRTTESGVAACGWKRPVHMPVKAKPKRVYVAPRPNAKRAPAPAKPEAPTPAKPRDPRDELLGN